MQQLRLPSKQQVLQLYATLRQKNSVSASASTASSTMAAMDDLFMSTSKQQYASVAPLSALTDISALPMPSSSSPLWPTRLPLSQRLLGLDVGGRQVGIALSDPTLSLATPHSTIERRKRSSLASDAPLKLVPATQISNAISRIIQENDIGGMIVGLPLGAEGEITQQCTDIQSFISSLFTATASAPPVIWWDETSSSTESRAQLASAGLDIATMKARGIVDSTAAAVILQTFLEHMHGIVDEERARLKEERLKHKREMKYQRQQQEG